MRVLVTGHDGYLGSGVIDDLRRAGHHVVGLDTSLFAHRALGEVTLPDEVVDIDVRDVEPDVLDGVDAVVHLAGLCNDPLGERDPQLTDEINHLATVRLARLAADVGARSFVFASTCSVYGAAGEGIVNENSQTRPVTAYARSKADAEVGLHAISASDMTITMLRLGTVYGAGPRLRADLVVNNLVGWALVTNEVRLRSDGTAWRPMLHVTDASMVLAAAVDRDGPLAAFNVTGPEGDRQVIEVARMVSEATGAPLVIADDAAADPRSYRVDGSRLLAAMPQAAPSRRLESGIHELVDTYRRHGFTRDDLELRLRRNRWLDQLAADGIIDDLLRRTDRPHG